MSPTTKPSPPGTPPDRVESLWRAWRETTSPLSSASSLRSSLPFFFLRSLSEPYRASASARPCAATAKRASSLARRGSRACGGWYVWGGVWWGQALGGGPGAGAGLEGRDQGQGQG